MRWMEEEQGHRNRHRDRREGAARSGSNFIVFPCLNSETWHLPIH